MSVLGDDVRTTIENVRAHRAALQQNKALMGLKATTTTALAKALGIEVLREEAGTVAVGMFEIPAMNKQVVKVPKSECDVQLPATIGRRVCCRPLAKRTASSRAAFGDEHASGVNYHVPLTPDSFCIPVCFSPSHSPTCSLL